MEDTKQGQQALAQREAGGAIVQRSEGVQVHRDSLMPPVLMLVQKAAQGEAVGSLKRLDTGEERVSWDVVFLASRVTQTLWPENFSRDATPICWSRDGVRPAADATYAGRICATCEFYNPRPKKGEGGDRCQTGHDIVVMDAESFDVMVMRLHGTANRVINLLSSPSITRKAIVTLYSEPTQGDSRGDWHQLKAKTKGAAPEDIRSTAAELVKDYVGVDIGVEASGPEASGPAVEEVAPPGPAKSEASLSEMYHLRITSAPVVFAGPLLKVTGVTTNTEKRVIPMVAKDGVATQTKFLGLVVGDEIAVTGAWADREVGGKVVREFVLSEPPTRVSQSPQVPHSKDKDGLFGAAKDRGDFPF